MDNYFLKVCLKYARKVQDVKKDVYELLKHYNCPNFEVLLKAFDDNFNTSEEWDLFYETVNLLFNQWYKKNH